MADASVMAARVDGVILVAQIDQTRKDALSDAGEKVKRVGGHLLGVILNRANLESSYANKYYGTYENLDGMNGEMSDSLSEKENGSKEKITISSVLENIKNKIG